MTRPCDFPHVLGYGRPAPQEISTPAHAECGPTLLRLVQESERAERAVDAYTEQEENDEDFVGSPEEWKTLIKFAGQMRAAVAMHPAKTMAEVALKARAVVANTESD